MENIEQSNIKEVNTFITKDKVTVNIHGKPNLDILAKKLIDLYNIKQNKSAS